MRRLAATALLLVFGGVLAHAQFGGAGGSGGTPPKPATRREENVQLKLLEIAQEVDETLLREAMLTLGRLSMAPKLDQPDAESARQRKGLDAEKEALTQFIEQRTHAITERAAELAKKRAEAMVPPQSSPRVSRPDPDEKPGRSEDIEKARVEVQLLQTQVEYSQQALTEAIATLAQAELAAGGDPFQGQQVNARDKFEKAKSAHVEYRKRLNDELKKLRALDPQSGYGGMGGGGMGGGMMGGGMR